MRIFGIDPGSERTGYGCVETDGRRHRLVTCGAITSSPRDSFPDRLARIHAGLSALLSTCRPDCVAVENLFHATNVRSALKLGHARGVAMLAAVEAGCPLVEYSPAEVKRAVVGYGRAEKHQVQHMVALLLGLPQIPTPHDAADALAVAICHLHSMPQVRLKPDTTYAERNAGSHGETNAGLGAASNATSEASVESDAKSRLSRSRRSPRTWRDYRPPAGG